MMVLLVSTVVLALLVVLVGRHATKIILNK